MSLMLSRLRSMLYMVVYILFLIYLSSSQTCLSSEFDASGICQPCDVVCLTCSGSSNSNCLSCTSTRIYESLAGTCNCIDGYEESSPVSADCIAISCVYSCLTCNNTAIYCTSCPLNSYRSLVSGSGTCPCNSKYYDSGATVCSSCHYTCQQCSTSGSTSCTSCNGVKYRISDGSGGCKCMDKYYNSGSNQLCSACNYKCATCITSSSNCLTCGANRATVSTCACLQGYYDEGSSQSCQACHYSCKTCLNSSTCASCDSITAFRQLVSLNSYCLCLDRYFQATPNTLICSSCHPTCFQCITSSSNTACTACSTTANRQLNGNTCQCKIGFYQTDPNVELCSPCHYTCKTCQTSSTTCTSCTSSLYRTINGNTCPCIDEYFQSSQTGLCTLCQSSCKTCTNATQCATCDTTIKLYSLDSSNLCSCQDTTYFNTTLNKCTACSISCKTCAQTSPTYCLSCDSGRSLVSQSCPCLPYYFDNGAICSACHYSCQSCNGLTNNDCLTCSSTNYRDSLSVGKCNCKLGYFDNGVSALCLKCSYQCASCVDSSTCASCDSSLFRSIPGSKCPCVDGYFQNSTQQCQKCSYYCITCSDAVTCLTCNSPNRVQSLTTLKCDCPQRFYDNGVSQTCYACLPQCKTCTNSSKCTSCQVSQHRTLSGTLRCPCMTKFYDSLGSCLGCEYYCATCTAAIICQTCNSTANRVLDPGTSKCICKVGYYDNGVQECQKCSYACNDCLTTATHCISCDTNLRTLSNNWCNCPIKLYDNNLTTICSNCQYTCASCINYTYCTTCNISKFRTFDSLNVRCSCLDKYYDDGINQICKSCSYKCKTCTNSTQCLTCDASKFRITPASLCPCMPKYYDSGLNSQTCLPCHYSCTTCNKATQCLTCQSSINHRTYNSTTKLCKCLDTFYDDGSNELCLACVYSCATCTSTSSNCLSCADSTTHRQLVISACPCQRRFFDGNLDSVCESCQYTCETCTDAISCDTCDITKYRQINASDDLCHCVDGYFDDLSNHETCQQCHLSCVTCSNSWSCLTCDSAKNRLLNSSAMYDGSTSQYCICDYGLYSPGDLLTCLPCHYSCEVCSGPNSNNCLYCDSAAHRYLQNFNKCICMNGYYDDGINQLCASCNNYCATCFGPLVTECTSCINPKFFMTNQTKCYDTCPSYSFNNLTGRICSSCSSHCLRCVDQNQCTECQTNFYLLNSTKKCYLTCPDGFWQNTPQKLCSNCPEGCKTCHSSIKCFDCLEHFYFDNLVNLCFSCYSNCKSCIGPAQDQCLSCYEPLYFKANKCHNLTCPYGQYVDSLLGCKYCIDSFTNSLTCNKTQAFLCLPTYKLVSGQCKICNEVEGYHIIASMNTCSEICGDGKLFDYQCDDGNQLNGDGCSKNCIIEEGWSCIASSIGSISVCQLNSVLSMNLTKILKHSGKNTISLYLMLSLPFRLTNNFNVTIQDANLSDFNWTYIQSEQDLVSVTMIINYSKRLQGKSMQISYGGTSTTRLLQQEEIMTSQVLDEILHQTRLLTLATITFNTEFQLSAFPPVDFYHSKEIQFFESSRTIIYYLALVLMIMSLLAVPKKTHLHSFTFSFIIAKIWLIFGLILEDKLDWVNFVLKDIKGFAFIGGISMGNCCHAVSSFYDYSSQLISNSLFVILAWMIVWVSLGLVYLINRFFTKCQAIIKQFRYFAVTVHLLLCFHIFYSTLNALYFYSIENPIDAFNTTFSIAMMIFCLVMVIFSWISTYSTFQTKIKDNKEIVAHETFQFRSESQEKQQPKLKQRPSLITIQKVNSISIFENNSFISEQNQVQQHPDKYQIQKIHIFQSTLQVAPQSSIILEQQEKLKEDISQSSGGFLLWDYVLLYNQDRKKSKYFLPVTLTMLYFQAVIAVLLTPWDKFYFIIVEGSIEIIYFLYIVIQRPFESRFTNFRICVITLLFITIEAVMAYYLYLSSQSKYFKLGQIISIYLFGITFFISILFCFLEHLLSWKHQIWQIIEPCLLYFRLRGIKKVHDMNPTFKTTQNLMESEPQSKVQKILPEQIDAFYMRMIKKQKVNKKYRQQRKMKSNLYSPY